MLERGGLATVVFSCLADIIEKVQPPRWIDLPYPLGFPVGEPTNRELQRRIIQAGLDLLTREGAPPFRHSFEPGPA